MCDGLDRDRQIANKNYHFISRQCPVFTGLTGQRGKQGTLGRRLEALGKLPVYLYYVPPGSPVSFLLGLIHRAVDSRCRSRLTAPASPASLARVLFPRPHSLVTASESSYIRARHIRSGRVIPSARWFCSVPRHCNPAGACRVVEENDLSTRCLMQTVLN